MTNSALKESALEKLEKLGLTKEEVLSLIDDGEATSVMEDGEPEEGTERKSWQHIFLEEHLGYYNTRYGTNYEFDEYYDGIVNERFDVHFKWKQLLGLEKADYGEAEKVNTNKQKFIDHGHKVE